MSYGTEFSYEWDIKKGLGQGGVLSAFLFSFNVGSILIGTSKLPHVYRLGINRLKFQAYADDVVLFFPTANGLQRSIDHLSTAVDKHDLKINV